MQFQYKFVDHRAKNWELLRILCQRYCDEMCTEKCNYFDIKGEL